MAGSPSSRAAPTASGMKLKTFLTSVMGLLSLLVFGLGCIRRNVLWLWIGFICALVSGIFVQLLIDRNKKRDGTDDADN
jgi:preprotein translocase subunit SecF